MSSTKVKQKKKVSEQIKFKSGKFNECMLHTGDFRLEVARSTAQRIYRVTSEAATTWIFVMIEKKELFS